MNDLILVPHMHLQAHHPLPIIIIDRDGSWPKLWDSALHFGSRHTIGFQNLSRLLVHYGRGLHPCPLCDGQDLLMLIIDHVIAIGAHKRLTGLNIDTTERS